jgi:hypothetical protein
MQVRRGGVGLVSYFYVLAATKLSSSSKCKPRRPRRRGERNPRRLHMPAFNSKEASGVDKIHRHRPRFLICDGKPNQRLAFGIAVGDAQVPRGGFLANR